MDLKIDKENVQDILPLTPMQEGMLIDYLNESNDTVYFEKLSVELTGEIDYKLLKKAWNLVVDCNELLRTIYRWEEVKSSIQIILKKKEIPIYYYDLSNKDNSDKSYIIQDTKDIILNKRVDIRIAPLIISLIKTDVSKYMMTINYHHILFDGCSCGIILKELITNYNSLWYGRIPQLPVKTHYKTYIKWCLEQNKEHQKEYWSNYLNEFANKTRAYKNISNNKFICKHNNYTFKIPNDFAEKLYNFAKNNKITLATIFYTAYGMLLQKYNDSDDIIFIR